ncbi:hypothetical protein [Carnimonas nigrificans]|uniref:hypothetical protein n=1 Tax=Carnimonas nigrificans TaxID=64323 RepID=UPI000470F714|nr:hypothetical protein [Carnimonas nigrificans]
MSYHFEIDPLKNAINMDRFHLPLWLTLEIIEHETCSFQLSHPQHGEEQLITFGYVGPQLHVTVWNVQRNTLRALVVRRANRNEEARYGD